MRIWVEQKYTRAAPGGLGATKAAANYANSLKAAQLARAKDFQQVLWLDVSKTYIEEVGTMNVFFVINNRVITPKLTGTILRGGTRDVALQLLKKAGHTVEERLVSLDELKTAAKENSLQEVFGTGTAAVVTPVSELTSEDGAIALPKYASTGMGPSPRTCINKSLRFNKDAAKTSITGLQFLKIKFLKSSHIRGHQ